ncbi:MarR family transcriptional regulator [Nocardia mexicana]|uniref:MarR family protein n=1 Tax=Nocardia mexicana TaxID=279262 RepID=A0A370H2T2_9NOCA|nr:MarR family transcriptional regulator [Nocardia mexicana]RDI49964.1 hypothetical protein DFR68_106402 [Nocardia mexicana]
MKAAEVAVLSVLAHGGVLTVAQIGRDASLTGWTTRNTLACLDARGLVVRNRTRGRWQINPRGRAALAVNRVRSS